MVSNGLRSTDRILVLKQIPGKNTLRSNGLTDNTLFTGGNKLHALLDESGIWSLQYEKGNIEESLRQKFTSFPRLMKHATEHYRKRNIKIEEVID